MIDLSAQVINCAHRGASGHAPENTLAALTRAVELGADMAEVDVRQTADGKLVVIHDETLERTTDGSGPVAGSTLAQLRDVDAGSWCSRSFAGEGIPTLEEVVDLARGRLLLNIEIKAVSDTNDLLDELTRIIVRGGFADQCVVTSFDHDLIDRLVIHDCPCATGYIVGREGLPPGIFNSAVQLLSIQHSLIGEAEVEFAIAGRKIIHAWTVNETADMVRLLDLGVGGIITNFPDRFPRRG